MRPSGRAPNEMRAVTFETNVNKHAEGSCLARFGDTHVLCTASVEDRVPMWIRESGRGWVTAEYGMLPRATNERTQREATRGSQGGRTMEIQRLIGRSLRAVVDLAKMPEMQIRIDCDVIQADGGTRTAGICGGYVALHLACNRLVSLGVLKASPLVGPVAAVSCGLYQGTAVLDLDYAEDSTAQADANFVLTHTGALVEVQATAEHATFSEAQLGEMITLARLGVMGLLAKQKAALGIA
jgi:ribonuclease PH